MVPPLIVRLLAGLAHPLLDRTITESEFDDRRFGSLDIHDHHSQPSARGTGVDKSRLAARITVGPHLHEWIPARTKRALDQAAHLVTVRMALEAFKYGQFQTADALRPRKKHRHTQQWYMHVVHAVRALNGAYDAAKLMVAGDGQA